MKKDLPGVFANKIEKDTNTKVAYTDSNERSIKTEKKEKKFEKNITQKINDIFTAPNYVYKAEVLITTSDGVIERKIVGRNRDYIISIDNELIPISSIKDISFK